MAMTGTEEVHRSSSEPGGRLPDRYDAAFALASALFQRKRPGRPAHRPRMLGVAMMMEASHLTGYFRNGTEPKPHGNKQPFATNSAYRPRRAIDDRRQQHPPAGAAVARAGTARHGQTDNETRIDDRAREPRYWRASSKPARLTNGSVFPGRHVPAARCVRWPKRWPTRISRTARVSPDRIGAGIDGRSGCRWPRSNSPMVARRSKPRRTRWAPIRRGAGRAWL